MKITSDECIAVIGVSRDPSKYGSKVYRDLKEKGYEVYGITPHAHEFDDPHIVSSLDEIAEEITLVVSVVPPSQGELLLKKMNSLGIKKIWFQPGSEDMKLLKECDALGIEYIANACIMFN